MSLFDPLYTHRLWGPILYAVIGFGFGISFIVFFSENYDKLREAQKENLSSNVSSLKESVSFQKEEIQRLTNLLITKNQLANQQQVLLSQRTNELNELKNSYNTLSQYYQNLGGSSNQLQGRLNTAQQNCSVMAKINQLESEKRNLVNQLTSVDVFNKNIETTKADVRLQLQQNHERIVGLQDKLSCS